MHNSNDSMIRVFNSHEFSSILFRFQDALKKCFSKQGKVPVFFERNYKTSHLQIQVVPVPNDVVPKLKMVFEVFVFKILLAHLFTLLWNNNMALDRSAALSFRVTVFVLVVLQQLSILIFKSLFC